MTAVAVSAAHVALVVVAVLVVIDALGLLALVAYRRRCTRRRERTQRVPTPRSAPDTSRAAASPFDQPFAP